MENLDIDGTGEDENLDYTDLDRSLYLKEDILENMGFQNRVHRFIDNISKSLDSMYKSYIKVEGTILDKEGSIFNIPYEVLKGELPDRDEIFYKNSRRLRAWYVRQGYSEFEEYFVHIFVYLDGTGYISYLTQEEENKRLNDF